MSGNLQQFSYHCPGLHGEGAVRQKIHRVTFQELFDEPKRVVIPIFQRRYCWDDVR